MDKKGKLVKILGLEYLQNLQDAFAAITRITLVLVDENGELLTRPSKECGLCTALRASPGGDAACKNAHREVYKSGKRAKAPRVDICRRSGLVSASVPVMLGDEQMGSWLVGQVRLKDGPGPDAGEALKELGLGEDELRSLVENVPEISRGQFDAVVAFLQAENALIMEMYNSGRRAEQKDAELGKVSSRYKRMAQMLSELVDHSDFGMYVTDYHTGEILMTNKPYRESFAVAAEEVLGKKCWDVGGPGGDTFCHYCPREKLLDKNGEPAGPYVWENFNPLIHTWLRCTNQAIYWMDGRLAHMVTYQDVTEQHRMRDELARIAFYDEQLAMPNSVKLQQDVQQDAGKTGRYLICFDVVALRRVNDAYGRAIGDLLLKTIAHWVQNRRFGFTRVYRVEGDAFALYFKDTTARKVRQVAETIKRRFDDAWLLKIEDEELTVLCSVTVAVNGLDDGITGDNLLSLVERTMEVARQTGEVAVYSEEIGRAAEERLRLELELRRCVKGGMQGFDVHYQPIIDPAAGTWKGLEALCRWKTQKTGPVPPLVFIKVAEQLGLIGTLGLWVLERAMANCKRWKLDAVPGFYLSVNLSPDQVMDEGFVDKVSALLKKYAFPGSCLCLEVTESTEFTFNAISRGVIDNLRFRGVRFSLDDFGTGYSSFNNLKNLPVSMLKTEREFIAGVENDTYMQYFFYSMAELAHAADMKLVAEGVETRQQLEVVLKNGADYVQGYYFSKPLDEKALEEKLTAFVQVDTSLYLSGALPAMEEHIFSGKEAYVVSPRLFKVMNQSMQLLLTRVDTAAAFDEVLELVGRQFGAARSYLYQKREGDFFENTNEWCAAGVAPRPDSGIVLLKDMEQQWLPAFMRDGMIVAADVARLPAEMDSAYSALGVKATAVMPMLDEGEVVGFVGLDDTRYREWLPEEIQMLRNLAMTMADTLKRERLQQQLYQNEIRFSDVLNNMALAVIVTDPQTDKILWANDEVKNLCPPGHKLEGEACYKAIWGYGKRCEGCGLEILLENPAIKDYTWEFYNPGVDRYYMVYDSMVRWEGGRKVHLQYSTDITDIKKAHKMLEQMTTVDALTGTQNRNSLIEEFARLLQAAHRQETLMAVVFLDIDRLKYANDTYGHSQGDDLIKAAVAAVEGVLRRRDVMGRYGGDEFVVLMPGCTAARARTLMGKAQRKLEETELTPLGETFTFSYGVAESTELPYEKGERVINALINLADDRMRDQKKMRRVIERENKA